MYQSWNLLTFVHWRYPAAAVQRLIPRGLELDLFEGSAWLGLVPFVLCRLRGAGLPVLPGFRAFPETNVRTYVRGPDGATGVWFFSLDAARLAAVLGARASFGLPYFWAGMRVSREGGSIVYRSRRHWPARKAGLAAEVEPLGSIAPGELTEFDHYLTARYRLFSLLRGEMVTAQVEHNPWPLQRARVARLDEDLVAAAGLGAPEGPPVVHYSEGVDVRVGPVTRVRG